MKKIKVNFKKINKEVISIIVDYLKHDKVIVYPTDTIYGLGCLATNKRAVNKIFKIKKRSKNKPLLILVSSLAMLKKYCYVSQKQIEYLRKIWFTPAKARPVSVILRSKEVLPKEVSGGMGSLAVRLPSPCAQGLDLPINKFLITMIKRIKFPVISTSLNISKRKNFVNIEDIDQYFKSTKPDLIINAGKLKRNKPSKIVDLKDINNIKVLRN